MGLLLDCIEGKKLNTTPVWFMRQAGRYMEVYRNIRKENSFLDMCYNPDLSCEVTMQPINEFKNLSAAIIFSDILPLLVPLGLDLQFINVGPVITNPITSLDDVVKLTPYDVTDRLNFVAQALTKTRQTLSKEKDLIGFSGAPFTLASYAIEGGSSKNFAKIKQFMYCNHEAYSALMTLLADHIAKYLLHQLNNGANLVQLFDSWGGVLSKQDYLKYIFPYTEKILQFLKERTDKKVILFVKGANGYFEEICQHNCDVLGLDWTMPIDKAAKISNNKHALQGNLDPIALLGSKESLKEQITHILLQAQENNVRHIFNLGHGIIPQTPVENVRYALDVIHEFNT